MFRSFITSDKAAKQLFEQFLFAADLPRFSHLFGNLVKIGEAQFSGFELSALA